MELLALAPMKQLSIYIGRYNKSATLFEGAGSSADCCHSSNLLRCTILTISGVSIRTQVIPTNEELVIAQDTQRIPDD